MHCRKSVIEAICLSFAASLQILCVKLLERFRLDLGSTAYDLINITTGICFDLVFLILGILGFRLRGKLEVQEFNKIVEEKDQKYDVSRIELEPIGNVATPTPSAPPYGLYSTNIRRFEE